MVAVLTVFANHLWDWPRGGFVGVDVFFVISGFLITGNLLRDAEKTGNVSFKRFYWNRVRRIVPAATVVLIATCIAAALIFLPFRAREVYTDAGWAFAFLSNWWFGYEGTDYFRAAADSVSPLQHYWSLSIEEQFYFVWPVLIFLIGVLVARKTWDHDKRMRLAGIAMSGIVAASLAWAMFETATTPAWAYFNTFSRVWELGVGALLACFVTRLSNTPSSMRPALSWSGLALIAASLFLISDDSAEFPAPWAILPVAGAALVIAAGIGEEPQYQAFLRSPISGYIGDISYSLYLVHWPVIIFTAAFLDAGTTYTVVVLGLGFGLAIASYHLVEQPLRKADWEKLRTTMRDIEKGRYRAQRSTGYATLGSLALIVAALLTYSLRPEAITPPTQPPVLAAAAPDEVDPSGPAPELGPLATELQNEIVEALRATEWPALDPPMADILTGGELIEFEDSPCTMDEAVPPADRCTWGSADAPTNIVLVGDSVALGYANPLRDIAENSNGQVQLHNLAMAGCAFARDLIERDAMHPSCEARKRYAVDFINSTRPSVVVVSNWYTDNRLVGSPEPLGPRGWNETVKALVDEFRVNVEHVVLLSPPPGDINIRDCFGKRGSTPADCVGSVTRQWNDMATIEKRLAQDISGVWIDARPWFCSMGRQCPAFAGDTATKVDGTHMTTQYGAKIHPVIREAFVAAGVLN